MRSRTEAKAGFVQVNLLFGRRAVGGFLFCGFFLLFVFLLDNSNGAFVLKEVPDMLKG